MKKSGYTLIELSVAMAIAATLGVTQMQSHQIESNQEKARSTGKEMFQYNLALSNFLVANKDDGASVAGSYIGSNWLKDSNCSGGTATDSYLPCNYLPDNKTIVNRIAPSTTITVEADGSLQGRTVWSPIIGDAGSPDGTTMGIAAMVASGAYISQMDQENSGSQGPTVFCPDIVSYSPSIDEVCGSDKNRMISISSSLSTSGGGSSEDMLRTDHGNTMKNVIEFDDGSGTPTPDTGANSIETVDDNTVRQIVNVARIYNIGAGSDSLILGKVNGRNIYSESFITANNLLENSVMIDGNLGVVGDAYLKGELTVYENAKFWESLTVIDTMKSKYVDSMYLDTMYADTRQLKTVTLEASSIDTDKLDSILVTASTANVGKVNASYIDVDKNIIVDGSVVTSGLTVNGYSYFEKKLTARGAIYTNLLYDNDDTSYKIDPAGTSRFNKIYTTGQLQIGDRLRLPRATVGDSCWQDTVSIDSSGNILGCNLGKWSHSDNTTTIRDDGAFGADNDIQWCEANEQVVGGGGECSSPTVSWVHQSKPVTKGSGTGYREGWDVNCHSKDVSTPPQQKLIQYALSGYNYRSNGSIIIHLVVSANKFINNFIRQCCTCKEYDK